MSGSTNEGASMKEKREEPREMRVMTHIREELPSIVAKEFDEGHSGADVLLSLSSNSNAPIRSYQGNTLPGKPLLPSINELGLLPDSFSAPFPSNRPTGQLLPSLPVRQEPLRGHVRPSPPAIPSLEEAQPLKQQGRHEGHSYLPNRTTMPSIGSVTSKSPRTESLPRTESMPRTESLQQQIQATMERRRMEQIQRHQLRKEQLYALENKRDSASPHLVSDPHHQIGHFPSHLHPVGEVASSARARMLQQGTMQQYSVPLSPSPSLPTSLPPKNVSSPAMGFSNIPQSWEAHKLQTDEEDILDQQRKKRKPNPETTQTRNSVSNNNLTTTLTSTSPTTTRANNNETKKNLVDALIAEKEETLKTAKVEEPTEKEDLLSVFMLWDNPNFSAKDLSNMFSTFNFQQSGEDQVAKLLRVYGRFHTDNSAKLMPFPRSKESKEASGPNRSSKVAKSKEFSWAD